MIRYKKIWLFNTLRVLVPGGKVNMKYAKSSVLNEEERRKIQGSSSQTYYGYKDRRRDRKEVRGIKVNA